MAYSPADMFIVVLALIPLTVIAVDSVIVLSGALVTGIKIKASGDVSVTIIIQPLWSTLLPIGVAGH